MKYTFRHFFVPLALICAPLLAAIDRAVVYAREVVHDILIFAFPTAPIAERDGLPPLIQTETSVQRVTRARTDSFVARRANRHTVGRGSGDPCLGLAIAA